MASADGIELQHRRSNWVFRYWSSTGRAQCKHSTKNTENKYLSVYQNDGRSILDDAE